MKYILTILITISITLAKGQQYKTDTTGTKVHYELDLGMGTYYQFTTFGNTAFNPVKTSQLLPRRNNNPDVQNIWGMI